MSLPTMDERTTCLDLHRSVSLSGEGGRREIQVKDLGYFDTDFLKRFSFFNVDHLKSLYLICYNIVPILRFGF